MCHPKPCFISSLSPQISALILCEDPMVHKMVCNCPTRGTVGCTIDGQKFYMQLLPRVQEYLCHCHNNKKGQKSTTKARKVQAQKEKYRNEKETEKKRENVVLAI